MTWARRLRFDGSILGVGSASGTRVVVGMWDSSPFGPVTDVMLERPDGLRILIAPEAELAEFVAATYAFDEVRIEPVSHRVDGSVCTVTAGSLQLVAALGRRTPVGWVLTAVPHAVARSPAWCRLIDPIARRLRPGVRTHGTAGGGRHEYYGALDERAVTALRGADERGELGPLRGIEPPVRFGFGSAPARPSLVRVTTLIEW